MPSDTYARTSDSMLTDCFLWHTLEAETVRAIVASLPPAVSFQKGETVFPREPFCAALGLIVSGEIEVVSRGTDRRHICLNHLFSGQLFGAASLFGGETAYVTRLFAVSPAEVVFLTQPHLLALFASYPSIGENYIRFLTSRIQYLNQTISVLTDGTMESRVLKYLLARCQTDGQVQLSQNMTTLAQSLGISRSSLYRVLKNLENTGFISRQGKDILITERSSIA